jgi:hypothetical protein
VDADGLVRKSVKRDRNRWGTWTLGVMLVVLSHGSSSTAEHTNRGRREKRRMGRALDSQDHEIAQRVRRSPTSDSCKSI